LFEGKGYGAIVVFPRGGIIDMVTVVFVGMKKTAAFRIVNRY